MPALAGASSAAADSLGSARGTPIQATLRQENFAEAAAQKVPQSQPTRVDEQPQRSPDSAAVDAASPPVPPTQVPPPSPPTASNSTSSAGAAAAPATVVPFSVSTFLGGGDACNRVPPQPSVAVGTAGKIMEITACKVNIYSTSGTLLDTSNTPDWFFDDASLDVRVIWDPYGQSFIAVNNEGDHLTLAVSATGDPEGNWCYQTLPALAGSGSNQGDFPLVGSDPNFIYVSNVVFNSSGTLVNSRLNAVSRKDMKNCNAPTTDWTWNALQDPSTSNYAYHIDPAIDYEGLPYADSLETFFDVYSGGGSHLSMWWIYSSNGQDAPVLNWARLSVPSYSPPVPVQEPGSGRIDPFFSTVNSAYEAPTGLIYASWVSSYNYGSTTNNIVDWVSGAPDFGSPTISHTGAFGFTGYDYYYPTIGLDAAGNLLFGYAFGSASLDPSSALIGMTPGGTFGGPQYAAQGLYPYTGNLRHCPPSGCSAWGDWYSMNANESGSHFWFASEVATSSDDWQTYISAIAMNDGS
jgi:hypothetical protein